MELAPGQNIKYNVFERHSNETKLTLNFDVIKNMINLPQILVWPIRPYILTESCSIEPMGTGLWAKEVAEISLIMLMMQLQTKNTK